MSAIEELRRLLDERGIHWWAGEGERKTLWESNGLTWEYFNDENGDAWLGFLGACEQDITPEQAIAATLGDGDYKQAADYWKGMYEELLTERIGEERDHPEHDGRYECPDCGNVVYYDELYGGGWTIYVEDYQIPFNHCPNCGEVVSK